MQAGLLLALDVGVMNRLGHNFQVLDVPEQALIASVRSLVVYDRAIWRRMFSAADLAGALAGVSVADQNLLAQATPPSRLVPSLPWLALLNRLRTLCLICREGTSIGRKAGAGLEVREPRNARLRTICSGMTAIPANRDGRGRTAPLA
ncbi:hypothetical protein ABIB58_002851 [Brevundimonas sp. UYEF29]|uniref:hypothetical protein n=1 Tax=Brevundimonas sp. UYEF29 TaxID=3156346 RepID=UPI0033976CD5